MYRVEPRQSCRVPNGFLKNRGKMAISHSVPRQNAATMMARKEKFLRASEVHCASRAFLLGLSGIRIFGTSKVLAVSRAVLNTFGELSGRALQKIIFLTSSNAPI